MGDGGFKKWTLLRYIICERPRTYLEGKEKTRPLCIPKLAQQLPRT